MTGMQIDVEGLTKMASRIVELEAENAKLRKALQGLPILVSNGHWSRIVIGPWTCSTCGLSFPADGTYHYCPDRLSHIGAVLKLLAATLTLAIIPVAAARHDALTVKVGGQERKQEPRLVLEPIKLNLVPTPFKPPEIVSKPSNDKDVTPIAKRTFERNQRMVEEAYEGAGGKLASIRRCESGNDYGAVSASGRYKGAYQFDAQTHRSVGGDGDASDDSPAEQDAAAARLMAKRGTQPWPNCGRR